MVITTLLVVLITEAAPILGPRASGVLGAFPVYAAILTVFGHRSGAASAVQVLRGLLLGLFGFAGFFLVLGLLIERAGIALAFTAAIATGLARSRAAIAENPRRLKRGGVPRNAPSEPSASRLRTAPRTRSRR